MKTTSCVVITAHEFNLQEHKGESAKNNYSSVTFRCNCKASMYHMLLVTVSERVLSWSLDNGQTDFSPPSFS